MAGQENRKQQWRGVAKQYKPGWVRLPGGGLLTIKKLKNQRLRRSKMNLRVMNILDTLGNVVEFTDTRTNRTYTVECIDDSIAHYALELVIWEIGKEQEEILFSSFTRFGIYCYNNNLDLDNFKQVMGEI